MSGPLHGLRGVVLTQAWAGTYCTQLLGFLGADIIQVEVRKRLDSWRGSYDMPMPAALREIPSAEHAWNCNPLYNSVNTNKRCVTLDLQAAEGREVFLRMVRHADFVAENFSPRVLGNLGLGYEALRQAKPDVILLSLSAYGNTGPWANVPGIGGTIEPTSGMTALHGYEGGPPLNSGQMYPDAVAGLYGCGAILAALHHRQRTGEGQYVDLSMQEANLAHIGDAALEWTLTGRQRPRMGNRHTTFAPHGIYPCAGENRWLAIACETEAQWQALCGALGRRDWAADERFAAASARKANEDALDAAINVATAGQDRDTLALRLSAAGVIAAAVLEADEVAADSHLRERRVIETVSHPEAGTWDMVCSPFHFSKTVPAPARPAPCLGEHNFEVFSELLGMSREEYEALVASGVSGVGPPDGS